MSADDLERLQHMLDACREARLLLLGLVKEIEIIGEAAGRISTEGRNQAPTIPWGRIVAMRNRLVHGYFNWDVEVIWSTLTTSLPGLQHEIEAVIAAQSRP